MNYTLHNGDCLEVLRTMPDNSVDAVVTDPPYGLSFMGKKWDYDVPSIEIWQECLRVLKPGGHLLAFAGTRTQHRMAVRIEDAGFEIRDMIAWVYGSGFPKSHDISKAIDKAAGAEREVVDVKPRTYADNKQSGSNTGANKFSGMFERAVIYDEKSYITAPATEAARQWQGWGTALKPALEPITVARKPFTGTVAANVLEWGTGGINVDGCRVGTEGGTKHCDGEKGISKNAYGNGLYVDFGKPVDGLGRFPANLIHDGSSEVVGMFPETKSGGPAKTRTANDIFFRGKQPQGNNPNTYNGGDSGSAARFFYCAKASKRDRDEGCEGMALRPAGALNMRTDAHAERNEQTTDPRANNHPTVKPTDLMRYLCRLVTPPGGIVLDPFTGSGSTGKAAILEGFQFVGIEREAEYVEIARARIEHALNSKPNTLF